MGFSKRQTLQNLLKIAVMVALEIATDKVHASSASQDQVIFHGGPHPGYRFFTQILLGEKTKDF